MVGKTQFFGLVLSICMVLAVGCKPLNNGQQPQKTLSAEQQKARLLKQIERKFEDPDAHFRLGQLYHAEGRLDDAEYHYKNALSFDPVYWPAQAALVKLQQDRGDKAKAQHTAEIYMNQVSAWAQRSLQLGKAFEKQQLGKFALACYQQALRLEPQSPEALKQLGFHYLNKNDKVRAGEYFRRSFNKDPYQVDVAYQLGLLGVRIEIERKQPRSPNKPGQPAEHPEKKTK